MRGTWFLNILRIPLRTKPSRSFSFSKTLPLKACPDFFFNGKHTFSHNEGGQPRGRPESVGSPQLPWPRYGPTIPIKSLIPRIHVYNQRGLYCVQHGKESAVDMETLEVRPLCFSTKANRKIGLNIPGRRASVPIRAGGLGNYKHRQVCACTVIEISGKPKPLGLGACAGGWTSCGYIVSVLLAGAQGCL